MTFERQAQRKINESWTSPQMKSTQTLLKITLKFLLRLVEMKI